MTAYAIPYHEEIVKKYWNVFYDLKQFCLSNKKSVAPNLNKDDGIV
jgi:hypothetical protein